LILSIFGVVIITASVVGLPAMFFFRQQLDRQAWTQVTRGRLAAQAAYKAQRDQLTNLANLAAQRPTLIQLLPTGNHSALEEYLNTMRMGAGLDHILVCSLNGQLIAHTGDEIPVDICNDPSIHSFLELPRGETSQVILTGRQSIINNGITLGEIIVGLDVDQGFLAQMGAETGLEHSLLINGQYTTSSLTSNPQELANIDRRQISIPSSGEATYNRFEAFNRPFYAARQPLGESGLEVEVALDVSDVAAAQRRLFWILTGGIVTIAALGAAFGSILSRYLSLPLVNLADAASRISQGDLQSPITVDTHVYEEAMVAQALESARINLQHTLTDLEQEKEWSNQLLESIVEGIMTLDNQHRITFFSHGAERITGWSREEVLGHLCDEIFHLADSKAPFSQFIPAPGQRNKIVVELADGHWASLSVTGARLAPAEAGEAEIAIVFRDVSSEEIIHHLLGQYIANVSHEFRTPLAALAASVELLLEEDSDYSPEETAELLSSLHLGILSLQTLVDNLLESASIEAGHFRVSCRPYSLVKIIEEASATMQPLLEKYEQRLVIDLPNDMPLVRIDPRRTGQVLINLLSNASKYGPPDEDIILSASNTNDFVRVNISDRGPGVSAENRDDLYRRFVYPQANPDNLKIGAGLGLSVVKAIVEAQGGQTGLEDRPSGGSTFWFTLPTVREEKGA
jgi:PAS domain S-box-containing protein